MTASETRIYYSCYWMDVIYDFDWHYIICEYQACVPYGMAVANGHYAGPLNHFHL